MMSAHELATNKTLIAIAKPTQLTDNKIDDRIIMKLNQTGITPDLHEFKSISNEEDDEENNQASVIKDEELYGEKEELQKSEENVQVPVIQNPPLEFNHSTLSSNIVESNENNSEDHLEDTSERSSPKEDQISRRISISGHTLSAAAIGDELKRLKDQRRNLLFGREKIQKKRKRRKHSRKKKIAKSSIRSTETRQATTTAGYGSLNNEPNLMLNKPLATTLRQHFSTLPNPLNFSSAVQRLIMNKLNPSLSTNGQHQVPKYLHSTYIGDATSASSNGAVYAQGSNNAYLDNSSPMNDIINPWESPEDATKFDSNKPMIPVEIIGLDPEVTNSILYGQGDASANSPLQYQSPDGSGTVPPKASSVLHVHHFHMKKQRPNSMVEEMQEPNSGNQPSSEQVNEEHQQPAKDILQQQVFMNEKGELVYLAVENQPPDSEVVGNDQESQQQSANNSEKVENNPGQQQTSAQPQDERAQQEQKTSNLGDDSASSSIYQQLQLPNLVGAKLNTHIGSSTGGAYDTGNKQHLLMISYKAMQNQTNNDNLSSIQNGDQEPSSNASNVAKSPHGVSNLIMRQPNQNGSPTNIIRHKSNTNGLTLIPIQSSKLDGLPGEYNDHLNMRDRFIVKANSDFRNSAKLRNPLTFLPETMQPQDNRVPIYPLNITPFSKSMMKMIRPGSSNVAEGFSGSSDYNLEKLPSTSGNNDGNFKLLNGLRNVTGFLQHPQQNLIENLALLKRFQQLNKNLQKEQQHNLIIQQGAIFPNKFSANLLNNLNDNEELLSALKKELKLNNSQPFNMSSYTNSGDSIVRLRPSNKFEMTQASDQSPPKYLRTQIDNGNVTSYNGLRNNVLRDHYGKASSSKLHPNIKHIQQIEESIELDETNGFSNLALAFIFIVSFVTLIIIALSMIYRHKRRSTGRCANLPGRSRLNLTQRTKHFMRSNFVKPNDITTVKTISLDSSHEPNLVKNDNRESIDQPNLCNGSRIVDRYNTGKKTFGQQHLSTFNALPSTTTNGKYQFSEEPRADIKTLNTKLQKLSHLKSLISAPEDVSSDKKMSANNMNSDGLTSGYLNVRHHPSSSTDNKHIKSKTNHNEMTCIRNQSFKKIDSDMHQTAYDTSTKGSSFSSACMNFNTDKKNPSVAQRNHLSIGKMSTINSITSENNSKVTSKSSVVPIKHLTHANRAGTKLIGVPPAPKNLIALPQSTTFDNHHRQMQDLNQVDRL